VSAPECMLKDLRANIKQIKHTLMVSNQDSRPIIEMLLSLDLKPNAEGVTRDEVKEPRSPEINIESFPNNEEDYSGADAPY
jgi:hypothetical protein